jgi:CspA family cold shock protein
MQGVTVMPVGTVKFFIPQKGYGFIKPQDGGNDVFVHVSSVQGAGLQSLSEGMRVGFDLLTDSKTGKTKAANLRLL